MAYSDLLAEQDKELEQLHQRFYADQAMIRKMQGDHFDQTRYEGQLERLQADFERQRDAMQTRFEQEQRTHLNEPDLPQAEKRPDISESQDKAVVMMKEYRQQQTSRDPKQEEPLKTDKPLQASPSASNPKEEDIKKMMEETKKRRQSWQYKRGGHKR
ncbi:hypothetical protein [uncultured Fibrella sp.]|uniref:hypothetical protein n=1 Tax=uncultured Fibrella sp. TaxID=1284596 RepID=UPI0035CBEECD